MGPRAGMEVEANTKIPVTIGNIPQPITVFIKLTRDLELCNYGSEI
jgi:hypothetical protein